MTFYTLPVLKMATPCILIASCSQFSPDTIVKEILKCDSLMPGQNLVENIVGYDWHIDTKYYKADVHLCTTVERTIGDQMFAESVEAFVVYFDPDQESTYKLVKLWLPYLKQIEPEVRILVCDRCSDNHKVSRLTIQTWCIDNGFELVELNPEVESDDEMEDDFAETTGINRIIQALQSHTWPNLQLKDNPQPCSTYIRQLMQEEYEAKNSLNPTDAEDCVATNLSDSHTQSEGRISENQSIVNSDSTVSSACKCDNRNVTERTSSESDVDVLKSAISKSNNVDKHSDSKTYEDNCKGDSGPAEKSMVEIGEAAKGKSKKSKSEVKEEKLDSLLPTEDMSLLEALDMDDNGGESFEKLFESFATMKDKANALPAAERKKYAEQVAVSFWRAMGGDEDEIEDLSNSD